MKKRKAKVAIWEALYFDEDANSYMGRDIWHWHLKSPYNGKIMCAGEPNGYSSRAKARAGYMAAWKAFNTGVEEVS